MTPPTRPDPAQGCDDSTVALAVARALRACLGAGAHDIAVDVDRGRVTLRGEVDWDHERQSAVAAAAALPGVQGVEEHLTLRLRGAQPDLASSIQRALIGIALDDARQVQVSVAGSVVTLRGRVHSILQRDAAIRAVAGAPGVSEVIDELQVIE